MSTTNKIAIGLSMVGGALLAAWLLTGDRKQKTRSFVVKGSQHIKGVFKKEEKSFEDADYTYV
jgi:hypothetical protein